MATEPAFHREIASGVSPEAVWPWPDDRGDCHCLTLRYSPNDETGTGMAPALPAQLQRAVPRRKAEFLAGRRCAAEAIRRLTGQAIFPGMGDDRAPTWPEGVVGAISHSGNRAIALAGPGSRFCGIGIDIEKLLSEEEARDIASQALTANERHNLGNDIDPFMTGLIFFGQGKPVQGTLSDGQTAFLFRGSRIVRL